MKKIVTLTIPQMITIVLSGVLLGVDLSLLIMFFRQWENRLVAVLVAAAVTINVFHMIRRNTKNTSCGGATSERHEYQGVDKNRR